MQDGISQTQTGILKSKFANQLIKQISKQSNMAAIFQKVWNLFSKTFDDSALLSGTSDIVVVQWDSGQYRSTPFLACFGESATFGTNHKVFVKVNGNLIKNIAFNLDKYGYVHPMKPSQQLISLLGLNYGKNSMVFELDQRNKICCEIYLYRQHDKILVSDVDGTLTKDDLGGLYKNYYGQNYIHEGYYELIEALDKKNVKIIWLTMRSLPLYHFSKDYIIKHTKIDGPLMTEPEQFFSAMKKQVLKKTGGVKTNMLKSIRQLFPQNSNPFVGGLGNRDNDAIAYRAAGIPLEGIFIVDTESAVHHLGNNSRLITYHQMSSNINLYFSNIQQQLTIHRFSSMTTTQTENELKVGRQMKLKKLQSQCYN